jgi:hypothetical protein
VNRLCYIFLVLVLVVHVLTAPFGRCLTVLHHERATADTPAHEVEHGHMHDGPMHILAALAGMPHEHNQEDPEHSLLHEPDVLQRDARPRLPAPDLQPHFVVAWLLIHPGHCDRFSSSSLTDLRARLPAPIPLAGRTCKLLV